MKKTMILILCVAMLLANLCACGMQRTECDVCHQERMCSRHNVAIYGNDSKDMMLCEDCLKKEKTLAFLWGGSVE